MTDGGTRRTRTDEVYEHVRADIFAGRLQPGQRLKFPDLCAAYDTSVGVAREALTRLTYERLVKPQVHQGYIVAPLTVEELADLTSARLELESLAFRQSIADGDEHWEAAVVATHHLLKLRETQAVDGGRDDEWHEAHEAFRDALLAGCRSRRLRETAQALRAEAELYWRWSQRLGVSAGRYLGPNYQALVDAALARDADEGARLLREQIAQTAQLLADALDEAAASA